MAVAAGVDDLARAQNGTGAVSFGVAAAGGAGWQLAAHVFGQRQAATGAGVSICAAAAGFLLGGGWVLQEVGRILYPRRLGAGLWRSGVVEAGLL